MLSSLDNSQFHQEQQQWQLQLPNILKETSLLLQCPNSHSASTPTPLSTLSHTHNSTQTATQQQQSRRAFTSSNPIDSLSTTRSEASNILLERHTAAQNIEMTETAQSSAQQEEQAQTISAIFKLQTQSSQSLCPTSTIEPASVIQRASPLLQMSTTSANPILNRFNTTQTSTQMSGLIMSTAVFNSFSTDKSSAAETNADLPSYQRLSAFTSTRQGNLNSTAAAEERVLTPALPLSDAASSSSSCSASSTSTSTSLTSVSRPELDESLRMFQPNSEQQNAMVQALRQSLLRGTVKKEHRDRNAVTYRRKFLQCLVDNVFPMPLSAPGRITLKAAVDTHSLINVLSSCGSCDGVSEYLCKSEEWFQQRLQKDWSNFRDANVLKIVDVTTLITPWTAVMKKLQGVCAGFQQCRYALLNNCNGRFNLKLFVMKIFGSYTPTPSASATTTPNMSDTFTSLCDDATMALCTIASRFHHAAAAIQKLLEWLERQCSAIRPAFTEFLQHIFSDKCVRANVHVLAVRAIADYITITKNTSGMQAAMKLPGSLLQYSHAVAHTVNLLVLVDRLKTIGAFYNLCVLTCDGILEKLGQCINYTLSNLPPILAEFGRVHLAPLVNACMRSKPVQGISRAQQWSEAAVIELTALKDSSRTVLQSMVSSTKICELYGDLLFLFNATQSPSSLASLSDGVSAYAALSLSCGGVTTDCRSVAHIEFRDCHHKFCMSCYSTLTSALDTHDTNSIHRCLHPQHRRTIKIMQPAHEQRPASTSATSQSSASATVVYGRANTLSRAANGGLRDAQWSDAKSNDDFVPYSSSIGILQLVDHALADGLSTSRTVQREHGRTSERRRKRVPDNRNTVPNHNDLSDEENSAVSAIILAEHCRRRYGKVTFLPSKVASAARENVNTTDSKALAKISRATSGSSSSCHMCKLSPHSPKWTKDNKLLRCSAIPVQNPSTLIGQVRPTIAVLLANMKHFQEHNKFVNVHTLLVNALKHSTSQAQLTAEDGDIIPRASSSAKPRCAKRRCRKKFCQRCLRNQYSRYGIFLSRQENDENSLPAEHSHQCKGTKKKKRMSQASSSDELPLCPACLGICMCAACRRDAANVEEMTVDRSGIDNSATDNDVETKEPQTPRNSGESRRMEKDSNRDCTPDVHSTPRARSPRTHASAANRSAKRLRRADTLTSGCSKPARSASSSARKLVFRQARGNVDAHTEPVDTVEECNGERKTQMYSENRHSDSFSDRGPDESDNLKSTRSCKRSRSTELSSEENEDEEQDCETVIPFTWIPRSGSPSSIDALSPTPVDSASSSLCSSLGAAPAIPTALQLFGSRRSSNYSSMHVDESQAPAPAALASTPASSTALSSSEYSPLSASLPASSRSNSPRLTLMRSFSSSRRNMSDHPNPLSCSLNDMIFSRAYDSPHNGAAVPTTTANCMLSAPLPPPSLPLASTPHMLRSSSLLHSAKLAEHPHTEHIMVDMVSAHGTGNTGNHRAAVDGEGGSADNGSEPLVDVSHFLSDSVSATNDNGSVMDISHLRSQNQNDAHAPPRRLPRLMCVT